MRRATRVNLTVTAAAFAGGLLIALLVLREPTEALTPQALTAARHRWQSAGITDYDLQFRMHGSVYHVRVRDDIVTDLTVDGRRTAIAQPRAYTVDGLFDVLQLELENLEDPQGPFAGPQKVVMRVRFNEQLGYIERYLRSGGGQRRGAVIELIRFERRSASESHESSGAA